MELKRPSNIPEEIWNELTESEKQERLDNIADEIGFVDWNKFSLDELCDILESKYRFSSSGDALAIHKLIEFYKKHKSNEDNLYF